jgi:hypothetical protein
MGDIGEVLGGKGFDTNSVPAATGFDPLPAGWYTVQVTGAEVKDTKKGGKRLALELTVVGEHYEGRKLFPSINLANDNPKAVEIGMRELAALGLACGLQAITDTAELMDKIVAAKVAVKQDEGFEPGNEVKAYKATTDAAEPTAATTVPAKTTTTAPAKTTTTAPAKTTTTPPTGQKVRRPWER